jgi:hypothetical protein
VCIQAYLPAPVAFALYVLLHASARPPGLGGWGVRADAQIPPAHGDMPTQAARMHLRLHTHPA